VNNLRFLWTGVRKDVATVRRDPFGLIIPIGIPLVLAVLLSMVFGSGGNAVPQGRLLVADEDGSIASSLLTSVFSRDPLSRMVVVRQVTRQEGRARIGRGDASALLIISKGLQQSFLRNQPFRLQLYTNPAQRILPRVIEEALAMSVDAGFYMQKIAGPQLRGLDTNQAPSDEAVMRMSLAGRQVVESMSHYLNPPLIQLETSVTAAKAKTNFAALFFPSMIFMSLMLVANSLAGEIWKERMAGTLRRLAATPVSLAWYLAGRLLFVWFVLLCIGVVGVVAVRAMAGVPVTSVPAAVGWVMFSGSALYLCLLFLVMHAQTPRTANLMGNLVIFPLAMLGGCFFPLEMMPAWMASIGRLTPNGWAVTQFQAILAGSTHPASLAASTAGLVGISAIAFTLSARRLRGGFLL
jgi:ABC-type multidrug transport system permease subunit